MQGADKGALTLLLGGNRRRRRIDRKEQQNTHLDVLLGFLLEAQRPREHRIATVARTDDRLAAGRLTEQIEAEHPPIAPVGRMDVVGHHVLFAVARRIHAKALAAGSADPVDQGGEGFRRRMPRQRDSLDARIEVLQLQLVHGPSPVIDADLVAAGNDASKPAQDHLVGPHPLA